VPQQIAITRIAPVLLLASLLVCTSIAAGAERLPIVGRWPYGAATAIAVDGKQIYAGASGGIIIFTLSQGEPVELARFVTPGAVRNLALSKDKLYVANADAGLRVYDVSNPAAAKELAGWECTDRVSDVIIDGPRAYAAAGEEGVRAIDLKTMKEVGAWTPPDGRAATKLHLLPGALYISLRGAGINLAVVDVSNPTALKHLSSHEFQGEVADVTSEGNRAYVLHNVIDRTPPRPFPTDTYLSELDVTNPHEPKLIRTLGPEKHASFWVEVQDSYAYLSSMEKGLHVVDLKSDTLEPLRHMDIRRGSGVSLLVRSTLYLAVPRQDPKGIWLLDVSQPAAPKTIANLPLPHQAEGVFISGNYAYVAEGLDGLRILDVSDPRHPKEVGHLEKPYMSLAEDLWVTGSEVYMADGNGLAIIDASDPTKPVMDTYIDDRPHTMNHWVEGCMRSGNYLYVAAASELRIFDVSDPRNVSEVATLPMRRAREVCVEGNLLYVIDVNYGLRIVDISNPRAPAEVGAVKTVGNPYDVVVKDGYAYVTDSGSSRDGKPGLGLAVIDVRDPKKVKIVSNLYGPIEEGATKVQGLDIQGTTVYMGTVYSEGVWKIDVSDPLHPIKIGHRDTPGAALNVKVRGDLVYVADYSHGLVILGTGAETSDCPPAK